MASSSKALKAQGQGGRGCLWIFGGIFIAVGGAVFWFFSLWPMIQLAMSMSWEETPCVIDSSVLQTHDGDDGYTYNPYIQYSYAYGDGDYKADRYTFVGGSSSGRDRHQAVVDRYPSGTSTICYVNPRAPDNSVLSRDLTLGYFFGFFGLLFVGAGCLVIFLGGRQGQRSAVKSAHAKFDARDAPAVSPAGPVILESTGGPIGRFVGVTIFAVLWNGIVGTVLFLMISDGEESFLIYLFMTPFVLVGLVLIVGVIYAVMGLFNPRIQVSVSQGAARLGSEIELNWAMAGASHRIKRLRIWLEGREEAQYTRGTDTYTDRHTFTEIAIITTNDHSDIARGRVSVSIPEYTMHSFDGGNNKIVWEIKVEGEIARWPDVSDTFEYTVLPLAVAEVR